MENTVNTTIINAENNVKNMNVEFRTINQIFEAGYHILVLGENRPCDLKGKNVKSKKESIRKFGVITPLQLIPAMIAYNEGLTLLDGYEADAQVVTDLDVIANSFVIEDGNNRYVAWRELRKQGDGPEDIKINVETNPHGTVMERLMEQQKEVVKWTHPEIVKAASQRKPEDKILAWAKKVTENKMKQTSMSLYLTGTKDGVKVNDLYNAGAGAILPVSCNVERAKMIYNTLQEVGFEYKHLNTRYLVQKVYEYHIDGHMDEVLEAFRSLTNAEFKSITDKSVWGKEGFLRIIDQKVAALVAQKEAQVEAA